VTTISNPIYSVDVIIPVYNGESFIEDALKSVNNQTYPPRKLIVVDDGSTDATYSIVNQFRSKIPLLYIKKSNGGLSSARNHGLLHSTSQLVAFLDCDDVWEEDKLENQIKIFLESEHKNLGVVYCGYSNIDLSGKKLLNYDCFELDRTVRGAVFSSLLEGNKIAGSGSGVLVKRDCFSKTGLFDETLPTCEDWDMWLRIAQYYDFDYVENKLVKLRRHSTSMSTNGIRMCIGTIRVLNKWVSSYSLDIEVLRNLSQTIMVEMAREFPKTSFICGVFKIINPKLKSQLFLRPSVIVPAIFRMLVNIIKKILRGTTKNYA
jgi:glycosyltransferase involved in cell wall biosynthesis